MTFHFTQKVLFKHCDPAGIVFYPRYFEMINDCVEAFFAEVLKCPFEVLLRTAGIPTAEISARFHAASRHGDMLGLSLSGRKLGRSSFDLEITAACGGEARFIAQSTLVYVTSQGRPQPWSGHLRERLETFIGEKT
jgi:4-hydroxybenzoyl-CoA thioesterase